MPLSWNEIKTRTIAFNMLPMAGNLFLSLAAVGTTLIKKKENCI